MIPVGLMNSAYLDAGEVESFAVRIGDLFATPQWLDAWHAHTAGAASDVLVRRHPDGTLAGLLPLVATRRHPTVLAPAGPWPGPGPSVLAAPEDRDWVTRSFFDELRSRRGWDAIMLFVPQDEPVLNAGPQSEQRNEANRVNRFVVSSWEELLRSASKNSRSAYAKQERRLHEQFDVRFRSVEDAEGIDGAIDALISMHAERWREEAHSFSPHIDLILKAFSLRAFGRGWLSFRFLDLDGEPAAATLNYRFANREFALMNALVPRFRETGAGISLSFHAIRAALEEGLVSYHHLPGDERYKDRLPNDDERLREILVAVSPLGGAAVRARQVRELLRRR